MNFMEINVHYSEIVSRYLYECSYICSCMFDGFHDYTLMYLLSTYCVKCLMFTKALERLLVGYNGLIILTLLLIMDQSHKGWVLQIAKVQLQTCFKHSKPCFACLVNF